MTSVLDVPKRKECCDKCEPEYTTDSPTPRCYCKCHEEEA